MTTGYVGDRRGINGDCNVISFPIPVNPYLHLYFPSLGRVLDFAVSSLFSWELHMVPFLVLGQSSVKEELVLVQDLEGGSEVVAIITLQAQRYLVRYSSHGMVRAKWSPPHSAPPCNNQWLQVHHLIFGPQGLFLWEVMASHRLLHAPPFGSPFGWLVYLTFQIICDSIFDPSNMPSSLLLPQLLP